MRVTPRSFLDGFALEPRHAADAPIEAFGRERDEVRLEVASAANGITHGWFSHLDEHLEPGDVLVVNNSATLPAALTGYWADRGICLHVSSPVPGTLRRLTELRPLERPGTRYRFDCEPGDDIALAQGGRAVLTRPHPGQEEPRLWETEFDLPLALFPYLQRWGRPITYSNESRRWGIDHYQTIFATRPGSSEMPSAGRPFSRRLVDKLTRKGIHICAITLHAGVSSPESGEPPFPEPYEVPEATAETINGARLRRAKVIAVGTTVVRALETVNSAEGLIKGGCGFTNLVIEPGRDVTAIDGLITGFHEPKATHLWMLEAIAGPDLLASAYGAALDHGYRWHEFGDSNLILR